MGSTESYASIKMKYSHAFAVCSSSTMLRLRHSYWELRTLAHCRWNVLHFRLWPRLYCQKNWIYVLNRLCLNRCVCVCVWESSHCKNTPIENSVLYRWSMCAIFGFIHKHYMYGRLWPDNWAIPNPEMRDNNFILWWTVKDIKGNANANFRWCQRQINIIALDKMRKQFAVVVNVVVCYCNILAISCVAFHCIPVNDCSQF